MFDTTGNIHDANLGFNLSKRNRSLHVGTLTSKDHGFVFDDKVSAETALTHLAIRFPVPVNFTGVRLLFHKLNHLELPTIGFVTNENIGNFDTFRPTASDIRIVFAAIFPTFPTLGLLPVDLLTGEAFSRSTTLEETDLDLEVLRTTSTTFFLHHEHFTFFVQLSQKNRKFIF